MAWNLFSGIPSNDKDSIAWLNVFEKTLAIKLSSHQQTLTIQGYCDVFLHEYSGDTYKNIPTK